MSTAKDILLEKAQFWAFFSTCFASYNETASRFTEMQNEGDRKESLLSLALYPLLTALPDASLLVSFPSNAS